MRTPGSREEVVDQAMSKSIVSMLLLENSSPLGPKPGLGQRSLALLDVLDVLLAEKELIRSCHHGCPR